MSKQMLWMPHAGHFILGRSCGFRLNTYVNGYIVSTVGELKYPRDAEDAPDRPLGAGKDSLYETMVFKAKKSKEKCCPYQQVDGNTLDSARYKTAEAAVKGHHEMLAKWSAIREGN